MKAIRLLRGLRSVGREALDLLYPHVCPWCGASLERSGAPFCLACTGRLDELRVPAGALALAGPDACAVLFQYEGLVRSMICRMKFSRDPLLARALGRALGAEIIGSARARGCLAVVPVPLGRRRLRVRGFNQAEVIAAEAAASIGLPLEPKLLARTGKGPPQSRLSPMGRARNLRGAIVPLARGIARGGAYLLVDDVLTTGSTLRECAAALRRAGAGRVQVAIVAVSPASLSRARVRPPPAVWSRERSCWLYVAFPTGSTSRG